MVTYVRPFCLKNLIPAAGAKTALAAGIKLIGQNALTQVYYYGASESEMVRHVPNGPSVQKRAVLAFVAGIKFFSQNDRGQVYIYGVSESEMVRHVPNGPRVQKLAVLALAAGFKIFGPNGRGQVYVYRGGASF